jgi:hypothetical protein
MDNTMTDADEVEDDSIIWEPTPNLRWHIPPYMPVDYPPILQQLWVGRGPNGEGEFDWRPLPLSRE